MCAFLRDDQSTSYFDSVVPSLKAKKHSQHALFLFFLHRIYSFCLRYFWPSRFAIIFEQIPMRKTLSYLILSYLYLLSFLFSLNFLPCSTITRSSGRQIRIGDSKTWRIFSSRIEREWISPSKSLRSWTFVIFTRVHLHLSFLFTSPFPSIQEKEF